MPETKTETQSLDLSSEEINALPELKFEGNIWSIDTDSQLKWATERLLREKVLGFDTETKPSFRKGEVYPVSLLQLSTAKDAYLFRLRDLPEAGPLKEVLESKDIEKVGVAIHDDLKTLQKWSRFKPEGFIEIQEMARGRGFKKLGLRALCARLLKGKLNKKAKLTNWGAPQLTPAQLNYAAMDAWASREIYLALTNL
jgi:ribonuclease D